MQQDSKANEQTPRLCLVFAPGSRPDLADIDALAAQSPESGDGLFSISHRGSDGHWAELLSNGLTFDCTGLKPGAEEAQPPIGQPVGLRSLPAGEVVALTTGPHLAGSAGVLPVLRALAALGARMAALPGVMAVVWSPATAWVEPELYRRSIAEWLGGGAFPALVLIALERESNGAMVSRGLSLMTGQELRFEPDKRLPTAAMARLAVRLIHELVRFGPLREEKDFTGPEKEHLLAVPVRGGTQVRILVSGIERTQ